MYITKHAGESCLSLIVTLKRALQRVEFLPLPSDEPNHDATIQRRDNDLLEYASSIIAKLRTELEFERREHGKTAEEANIRIEELEAKVAVREAELETCINAPPQRTDDDDDNTRRPPSRNIPKKAHFHPKTISDEECLRVLESNSARNKSLEMEIYDILAKVSRWHLVATNIG